jgi:AmmeMemoRadiSam system protein A
MRFTDSEKRTLLELAGKAIAEKVDPLTRTSMVPYHLTQALESRCGAFVSVYVDQKLRGCIGTFSEEEPLYLNVKKMAVCAAIEDGRFKSIRPHELSRVRLEISVLTPRQRIYDPSEIIIGKHGIYIKKGDYRGTLLPQVAVAQNWSAEEFLGNCARNKAGIGWDGWKTAELFIYEAIVFQSENPLYDS